MGINRGISTVSENSKIMIEKAQVNTAMQDIEKGRSALTGTWGSWSIICKWQEKLT